MKKVYEITGVKTIVEYTRYDELESGGQEIKTKQSIIWEGLKTEGVLIEEAKTRIAPGEDIEVRISDKLVK